MDHETAGNLSMRVIETIGDAVVTDRTFLETVMTGILARGHVLLEDVPGTGKTLTAQSFATALDLSFQRIQFTPDLLPSDITGSNIYSEATGEFEFSRGPIFANVVLADEINRAPPKTQAALLEAMAEKQVTVDGTTHELPTPFFVIATQNPVEQDGTFGLPEAQRDRFMIKTAMGYPDAAGERLLLDRRADRAAQTPNLEPVVDGERVAEVQRVPETVAVDPRLRDYIVELGRATRRDDRIEVGVSPRGIQRLFEASRARATLSRRDYVVPDDIKRIAASVFVHRLILTPDASVRGIERADVLSDVLESVEVPAVSGNAQRPGATGDGNPSGRQSGATTRGEADASNRGSGRPSQDHAKRDASGSPSAKRGDDEDNPRDDRE
jgi:MoxR-like ATPase